MNLTIKQQEKIYKALGDANRLKILYDIASKGGCGQCSDLQGLIDLAQPSISHHVKTLIEAGLLEAEKEGRNYRYHINTSLVEQVLSTLHYLRTEEQ